MYRLSDGSNLPRTSDKEREILTAAGYEIEDISNTFELPDGPEFIPMFRWINNLTKDFQDDAESFSIEDAWAKAKADHAFRMYA